MFSPLTTLIAIVGLAMLSAGVLAYVLLYSRIEANDKVDKRVEKARAGTHVLGKQARARIDATKRRKSVQETLKEIEDKQRAKARKNSAPPLSLRIAQAGLNWSRNGFLIFSAICGVALGLTSLLLGAPLWAAAAILVTGVVALPRWILSYLRKRRVKRFLSEFANAVDVIVRGVKAGLPLNECIRIVAAEAAEPVRSEFRQISESQSLGLSMAEAVAKLPDRVPAPEANFFAIAIGIQQQAGGNLSEALGNLSRVLRERTKMRGKIRAMSMEAKASAVIIGSLPLVVMALTYFSSPDYIMLLFTEPLGNLILVGSAIWMAIGIFVMRQMVNFDF